MISVVTASYNYGNLIKETIESVIAQTFEDWELIIVDDGSKDNSVKVIEEYCQKDSRIKLFTHENNVNKGLAETVRLGISKCCGEYISFLESDDTWEKEALQHKIDAIKQNPYASIIVNDLNLIGEQRYIKEFSDSHRDYFKRQRELLTSDSFDLKEFVNNNWLPTFSCITVKKEYIERADFNTPSKPNLDWYLWVQILIKNSNLVFIDSKDTNWRVHGDSYISARNKNDYEAFFGTIHRMICDYLPRQIYNISEFLHKPKVRKVCRTIVRNFDKLLIYKYPYIISVKRISYE